MARARLDILIADDDPQYRELLRRSLVRNRRNVAVRMAETGDGFLEEARRQRPDCVILDYHVPPYNAQQLIDAARADLQDCPVLAISSSLEQEVVINSVRSGAVDFVPKMEAINSELLWERLDRALAGYRRRHAERRRRLRRAKQLIGLAETDSLTGLYNRRFFERCQSEGVWSQDRRGVSCVMIDLDWFKAINDRYGHACGDAALKSAAGVIRQHSKNMDAAVRWGGEEFLIIRSGCSLGQSLVWAEELRKQLEQHVIVHEGVIFTVKASMGVAATFDCGMETSLVQMADEALYLAKARGRNQVCTWQMVVVDRAIAEIETHTMDPLQRRELLLGRIEQELGVTQREHTTTHCLAVSELAVRLGRSMGMDEASLQRLGQAAIFHDIGKSIVPEDLLAMPCKLSAEEYEVVGWHANAGAEIGLRLGIDEACAQLIRQHHLPFATASGAGDMAASVLAVADAFVAIRSCRPYHVARPTDQALLELRNERHGRYAIPVVEGLCRSLAA